jgi:phosphoglycolate phosphatase-like HAD superfamily hydrolase
MVSARNSVSPPSPAPAWQSLRSAALVFWDFDGVIKDSVTVKSIGFEKLFLPHGAELAARVRRHHEANSGISRYQKIAEYLQWIGESATAARVEEYAARFGELVVQAVIDAAWVPGVREYLLANHTRQTFVLVTATPEAEIRGILGTLQLDHVFREVHGAPTSKADAIHDALPRLRIDASQALMIGDSEADLRAAERNGVAFLLRRTALNHALQQRHRGPAFDGLDHE